MFEKESDEIFQKIKNGKVSNFIQLDQEIGEIAERIKK